MNFPLRRSLAIALLAGACIAAFGAPVMNLRADVLLPMASELKKIA